MTSQTKAQKGQTRDDKDRVVIFDTTLRDGEQCPGATMTFDEKLEVAELLDFPPGWRSRVSLKLEAPPAREAVTRAFYADLRKRADELGKKKYRVDAPRGFLNVHSEPDDPFRLDNVVEQLDHGTVVTATEERDGWVRHDMGGWSIREHGGHAFLVPLDDEDQLQAARATGLRLSDAFAELH